MILTTDFDDLVKNAKYQWDNAEPEMPEVRSQIATIVPVTTKTSSRSIISSLPTAKRRNEGDDSLKGEPLQGYTKSFNQAEISLQADVTKQMRMFDQYDEIMERMRGIKRSVIRRPELDIASLLSYAWSTSYTNMDGETVTTSTPDGLTLIDAAHVPNKVTTTWSNELGTTHDPISHDTLENLIQLFNNFLDDGDGRSIPVMPTHIITGSHIPTVNEVKRILTSLQRPGSGNNDTNVNKGLLTHIIVPFLDFNAQTEVRDSTKARYVFIANLTKDRNGFVMEVSQEPRLEAPEQVFESGTWQFLGTALYDFGTTRANFISGSKGDGSSV
jgi:hypothetical protein